MMSLVRILIADDHGISRDGLESLLQKEPMFEVIRTTGDGREAVSLTGDLRPDVLVLGIGIMEVNSLDVARQVGHDFPQVKIIGLSVHADRLDIEHKSQDGALYLPRNFVAEDLCTAIRAAVSGETPIGKPLPNTTLDGTGRTGRLSLREQQVLRLLAEGHSARESADRLNISVKTIDVHRRNIRQKLGISPIAELTKYAIRMGITTS